jgi:hypothetical protein
MLVSGSHRRLTLENQEPHHQLRDDQGGRQEPHDHEKRFHQLALSFKIDQSEATVLAFLIRNIQLRVKLA